MLFRRPVLDLVLPMQCLLCEKNSGAVCLDCEESLNLNPRTAKRFDFEGVAFANYEPTVAKLISHYKSNGMLTLAKGFSVGMATALNEISGDWFDSATSLVPVADHLNLIRPYSHTRILAAHLAPRLGISWLPGLSMRRETADQAGLSSAARSQNMVNGMVAKNWMSGKRVLLLDDLVTTGSTLREARRALLEVGCEVTGFVTFAETLKKTPSRN